MKILIDTNVLMDYLAKRSPYSDDAEVILNACTDNKLSGCIAAHSISNLFYILRKAYSVDERKKILRVLCTLFEVIEIDKNKMILALDNKEFEDFEDCLQLQCALDHKADYIITRNLKDFTSSPIECIEPAEFIRRHLKRH